ncbi:MAG TPA: hypothetical protein VN193_02975 [Candidatus Angelobacter sp.]|nr:hypothetical protein [Candidatus Angelobacter sp.]
MIVNIGQPETAELVRSRGAAVVMHAGGGDAGFGPFTRSADSDAPDEPPPTPHRWVIVLDLDIVTYYNSLVDILSTDLIPRGADVVARVRPPVGVQAGRRLSAERAVILAEALETHLEQAMAYPPGRIFLPAGRSACAVLHVRHDPIVGALLGGIPPSIAMRPFVPGGDWVGPQEAEMWV